MTYADLLALVAQAGGGVSPGGSVIVFSPDQLVALAEALGATVDPDPQPMTAAVHVLRAA